MAKTFTIATVDYKPQLLTNSARITELIQNKSNSMTIQLVAKSGDNKPTEGSEVIYKDGARFLFAGFITRVEPTETGKGEKFIYDIECLDYTYILNNKTVAKAYENQTLKQIVDDIIGRYVDSGYNFTTTNVQTGPVITSVTFDHISIRSSLEKLSKLTGFVWWVDYERNLYFIDKEQSAAPEAFRDNLDNVISHNVSSDTTQVRNAVTVIGSDSATDELSEVARTDTFTALAGQKAFNLDEKPATIVTLTVNGVAQTYAIEGPNDAEDFDVLYSFQSAYLKFTVGLAVDDVVAISYFHPIPIIARRVDTRSVDALKVLEGGDGEHQMTIRDTKITTKAEAGDRAEQELEEFADPLIKAVSETRTGLLQSGSLFKPGQFVQVQLATYGITAEATFLIQEVSTSMIEDEDNDSTEYYYSIRWGGRLAGVTEFLESLAREGTDVQETDKILTLIQVADSLTVGDSNVTRTIFTPPFKVGPAGSPIAVVNKSEVK